MQEHEIVAQNDKIDFMRQEHIKCQYKYYIFYTYLQTK